MSVPRDDTGKLTDWTDVAQLDYNHAGLRREMIAAMQYWLTEFGIDGFRVDVAGFVPDAFWREAIPALRGAVDRPILLLAEWGDLKMHHFGFDLTYGWDGYGSLKAVWKGDSAVAFVRKQIEDQGAMPPGGMRLRFTTNHDETAWDQPPVTLFGGSAGARAAFVAMALMPGRPMLYNGQEIESPQKLRLFYRDPIVWSWPGGTTARAFYRKVMDLARADSSFMTGRLTLVETSAPADVVAYRRGGAVVLVNVRNRPVSASVLAVDLSGMRDVLTGRVQQGNNIALPAYAALVLQPMK
jgi:glycosidase